MTVRELTSYLQQLDGLSGRIEITKILSELYKELSPDEAKAATYLLIGSLGPRFEGVVFHFAENMMIVALATAAGMSVDEVKSEFKQNGDLGVTAGKLLKHAKKDDLSVTELYQSFLAIAKDEGKESVERKIQATSALLKNLSNESAKYVVRMILGNLRLGFSDKTIIDGLSWMEFGDKSASKALTKAYEVVSDIGELARKVKKMGSKKASVDITPVIGIPVMPMLAARLKSPADMIKKMEEVAIEPKFDGLRVQIHFSKSKKIVKAFTRNLNDISEMFPELTELASHINADEIILDSEAVGMDPDQLKIADFQTTMQRRRKHDISEMQSKIPLTFQVFDILFKDGEGYMHESYTTRRELLAKTVKEKGLLKVDEYTITTDPDVITEKHHELREMGLEGIIVKKIDSEYIPGRLGYRWVKMKEAEAATGKLSDTVDAVIMGYTQGQGKRASFGIGQFLVGVVSKDQILTISKVGTGLSDDQFKELSARLHLIKVDTMPAQYEVHKNLTPDFWVKPEVVVELAADDLTVSPNHTAGYALRFPRLVKFRDDKSPKQATTVAEIKKLFDLQKK